MSQMQGARLEGGVDRRDRTSDVTAGEHLGERPGQRVNCTIERAGSTVVDADPVTYPVERLSTIMRRRQPAGRVADADVQLRVVGHPQSSHLRDGRSRRSPADSDGPDDLAMRVGECEPPAPHSNDPPRMELTSDVAPLAPRGIQRRVRQHALVQLQMPDHRFHVSSVAIGRVRERGSGHSVESRAELHENPADMPLTARMMAILMHFAREQNRERRRPQVSAQLQGYAAAGWIA